MVFEVDVRYVYRMARAAPASVRAVNIVSFLTAHPSRGFTISELAQHLGMNIASAHATLAVLCDSGFLIRDPVHRTYVLGPALAATGFAALEQHPAIEAAIEQAEVLSLELDVEVGLSGIAGTDVIFLARRGPEPLTSSIAYVGDRSPLLAPIGAVFVAWDDDVSAWLERGDVTPDRSERYRSFLREVRTRGFSVMPAIPSPDVTGAFQRLRSEPTDNDAEQNLAEMLQKVDEVLISFDELSDSDEIAFKALAAPIFDPIGRVLLSLSITGSEQPVGVDRIRHLGRRLAKSASIATRRTRGRVPGRQGS